jgi:hypothetical protein
MSASAPPAASSSNTNERVTGLGTRIAGCVSRDAAEGLLPVIVPMRAAPAQVIPTHGMVDVAALDVTTLKVRGGGDI